MAAGRIEAADEMPEETSAPREPLDVTNKSVIKATVLLGEIANHRDGITLTELAHAVHMSRPTAFRLLLSLEQTGFVDRAADNRYTIGWKMARIGRRADPYSGVVARVQPILDDYAGRLNETLGFAMLRGELDFDLIAEASGSRMLNVSHQYVGGTFPLHASASGKVILAELDDTRVQEVLPERLPRYTPRTITSRKALVQELHTVRENGYAILDDELEEGLFAVGFPVRDAGGSLIAILTVNGPTQRLKSGRLEKTVELGREAAEQLAKSLI